MFEHIFYRGKIIFENELFKHYHTAEMLLLYDGNFLQFKRMPSLEECEKAVEYLKEFHQKNGQEHIKLLFPENEKITGELERYFKQSGFESGLMEVYHILPSQFLNIVKKPNIVIQKVTIDNWGQFTKLAYEIDAEISEDFAMHKKVIHEKNFKSPKFMQLIAFYDGKLAGTVDVILGEDTAEIDGLVVLPSYRNKGIGSHLQQFVMEECADKRVILVADGEDTPKEMYKKQNYQYAGFKYEALLVY
ncbi:GNAT family N-acetyltransferase [Robertmurraya massiliosenegalensis]|uniref:GNAT family N-acetyltransferase n=1 Tax=Robertmurraya massiliosenegalensis TaxID=1287657 RepID=UPI00031D5E77|nr:GNAT family N-acetyltransferase [Robertmurraya massiliosenegalensis]